MEKNFNNWNVLKKKINIKNTELYFKDREVWWCTLGLNIGFEQDGVGLNYLRPVLVYKKLSQSTFLGIPFTTSNKVHKYRIPIKIKDKISSAIISQIRLIDSKRLTSKIMTLPKTDYEQIRKIAKDLL